MYRYFCNGHLCTNNYKYLYGTVYIYIFNTIYMFVFHFFFLGGGGRVPLPYHCNVKHSATRSCCLQIALRFFLPPKAEIVTLSGNATLAVGEMVRYVPALNIPSCHIWVFPKNRDTPKWMVYNL